ncbi:MULTISPECIES: DsrE family protein [unclassified Citromicrobium]|uniref:DsrE family protein n=1 Tax=unclassified Citromicrobium TaxID=2630544 RepID=UPI000A73C4BF|nr:MULTISPECIES: DsrE family protein [unclassified Citromicrobium]
MRVTLMAVVALAIGAPAAAQEVSYGPVFTEFGPVADVPDADFAIPEDASFHVAFDVSRSAEEGKLNRGFESAARLINMNARAGVEPMENRAAVVVHGAAVLDLLTDAAWVARHRGEANPSGAMVREMIDQGVRFIVCGQSAAGQGVAKSELIPGVELALSAMTAHALLQQQGYTVNPF